MNTMLIMNNTDAFIQLITDRFIIFLILFIMLMVGAFTRNSTMDKSSSFREMMIMSLFFALAFTLASDAIMSKLGYSIFFYALFLGLIEKEALQLIKKFTLNKLKAWLASKSDKTDKNDSGKGSTG